MCAMPTARRPAIRSGSKKAARTRAEEPARELERLRRELARAHRENRALRNIGEAMGGVDRLDHVIEVVSTNIAEALDADRATIFVLDERGGGYFSLVTTPDGPEKLHIPAGQGLVGHAAATGAILRVRDAYDDPRFLRGFDEKTGYRTRSVIVAPMRNHRGANIGVVMAINKRRGPFSKSDEGLIAVIAAQAAVAFDNQRMYQTTNQQNRVLHSTKQELTQRVRELGLLFSLESAMAKAATIDELVEAALRQALDASFARGGAVLLPDEGLGHWTLRFLQDDKSAKLRRLVVGPSDGFVGRVRQSGSADLTTHAEPDDSSKKLDEAFGFDTVSAVGAPLEGTDGATVGAVALYNKKDPKGFSESDLALLRLIAANVSTALQLWLARRDQERRERLSAIGGLVSSVIHDLKTPITVVSGYVQLMVGADDPRVRHDYAELVRKQFDLVTTMQRELLEYARGERSLLVRRVYLASFVTNLVESMRRDAADQGVVLGAEIADRGVARFDEGGITRVLHNLVRNSLDALAGRGGHVVVRVAREEGDVVFSVTDDGPGIPKDVEARLFESFATSGKKGGTGLGLATVRKVVEEHGGTVSAETSAAGTTMRFRLPQRTETPH